MTMKPQVLESAILEMSNYYDFLLHIEDMSHLTVPYLVQGDFRVPTAPNGAFDYIALYIHQLT